MAAENDLWVAVMCEVGKRVLRSDPSDKPFTFPRLIAALQFAIVCGGWSDRGRVLLPHRLAVEEAMREDPGSPEDPGDPWWPRMRTILGGSLQEALDASVTGDVDALEWALSETLSVTAFCETLFSLSEVDLGGYGDEFAVAVQGLMFESERRTIEVDDVLKVMGVFDVDELTKDLTEPLIARAREASSQRREDGPLLRGLSGVWGVRATRGWESGPWIVIPSAWTEQRDVLMGPGAGPPPRLGDMGQWLRAFTQDAQGLMASPAATSAVLGHAPWVSAVLQVPHTWKDEVSLKWNVSAPPRWIRYGPLPGREASLFAQRPWLDKARVVGLSAGDWMLVEVVVALAAYGAGPMDQRPPLTYEWSVASFALDPQGVSEAVALGHVAGVPAHGGPGAPVRIDPHWLNAAEASAVTKHLASEFLFYLNLLAEGEEHPVAVQPRQDRKAAPWKKPWLRRDRPYVILLNPLGVEHRRAEPGPLTGQHVRLHQRRGHWRHYRSERYSDERRALRQWIRQSWAGDREWATAGSTYRVMTNPDGSLDTGQGG